MEKNDLLLKTIEEKVKYINENRDTCENTLSELNHKIDLDYVKQSEFIENNTVCNLDNFSLDDSIKILRCEPCFIQDLPNDRTEKENFLSKMRNNYARSSLVILHKDSNGKIVSMVSDFNNHLGALNNALKKACKEFEEIRKNKNALLDAEFIEEINKSLFLNTKFDGVPGYGTFRKTMYCNGGWFHLNVKCQNAPFEPADSDDVYHLMSELINDYNKSSLHPIEKALRFKVDFIKIHPFRDGNGRTSRILLNYMLARYGYPTITIKGNQKSHYISAMNNAIVNDDFSDLYNLVLKALNSRCDKYIRVIDEQKTL